jgi:GntR family transcriptional regulator of gluconate operon
MREDGRRLSQLSSLRPPQLSRLSEQVASRIADGILSGELQPGEHLVEAALATSMQVSKSPVREALRDLAARGLITIQPRRGAFVRSLTVKNLRDISVLRATLEALAVNLGVARADPQWMDELRRGIRAMRQARGSGTLNTRHVAFHHMLISRCDNQAVLDALEAISAPARSLIALGEHLYSSSEAVATDHEALIDAVLSGDPNVVRAAFEEHILATEQQIEAGWRGTARQPGTLAR